MTIELIEFQAAASKQVVDRFVSYAGAPVITGTKTNFREVAFFQFLSSLTASGKTVMMADAIAGMAAASAAPPAVLWLSRGKIVVKQTFANLLPGGKYNHLLQGAEVRALADFDADELRTINKAFVFVATVGTFTRADREGSDLAIYKSDLDDQDSSTWELLKERLGPGDLQRPLIVVYDEAHNLSDLQTELLLEQNPAAFVLASATMRLPSRMEKEIQLLRVIGWDEHALTTQVDARRVAESGLIKNTLSMAGYRTPMEEAVAQLLADKSAADEEALLLGAPGPTKAIYVCNTNIVEGDSRQKDNTKVPFKQRQAPPILIWRYLVEQKGVEPEKIAVYSTLAFDKNYPAPEGFVLFKGAIKDYNNFVAGDFEHIIFNLSLQEGWDDPLCYFAYVDKSMDSRVQVEQIVGRVLRQPGLKRYASSSLNTAHFYIRVDRNDVFAAVLEAVESKLSDIAPEIEFVVSRSSSDKPIEHLPKKSLTVPSTALMPQKAAKPIHQLLENMNDYRSDSGVNIASAGARTLVRRKIGQSATGDVLWEDYQTSSTVLARWIFSREIRSRYARALEVALTTDPKFDARIGLGSKAEAHIVETAKAVVDAYLDEVEIKQKSADPYTVGSSLSRDAGSEPFEYALHAGYSGLNSFERDFAKSLDGFGLDWCRNPSRVGYGIPLVTMGATSNFYPDFITWKGDVIHLIDTKGEHLIAEAVARKLLTITQPKGASVELRVSFVSKGQWKSEVQRESALGYTLWGVNAAGNVKAAHHPDIKGLLESLLE